MSSNHKEYKAKTIEEAIVAACSDLKVDRDELEVEVVSAGTTGIFGLGRKKAVIRVSRRPTPHPDLTAAADRQEVSPSPVKARHHSKSPKEPARPGSTSRPLPDRSAHADEAPATPPSPEVLAEIKELIQTLLRLMGHLAVVTTIAKGHKVTAHINAEADAGAIIGRDGSTLDAIQYLLRKIITQRFPEKIVLDLDAGNYREDRRKELEELALELAGKVKETGRSEVMSALNPAERRIVHVTLQDDPTIRSASIGEGLFKKVRIYLPGKGRKRSSGPYRAGTVEPEGPTES